MRPKIELQDAPELILKPFEEQVSILKEFSICRIKIKPIILMNREANRLAMYFVTLAQVIIIPQHPLTTHLLFRNYQ